VHGFRRCCDAASLYRRAEQAKVKRVYSVADHFQVFECIYPSLLPRTDLADFHETKRRGQ
jgi:hypothetical protein